MKRVDANQSLIVRDLRKAGAKVQSLAELGGGVPDLLVGFREKWCLMEIKDPNQPPSKRKLTPREENWHQAFKDAGPIYVVETSEDALRKIGAIK